MRVSFYDNTKGSISYIVRYGDFETDEPMEFDTLPEAKAWVKDKLFQGVPFKIYKTQRMCKGVR